MPDSVHITANARLSTYHSKMPDSNGESRERKILQLLFFLSIIPRKMNTIPRKMNTNLLRKNHKNKCTSTGFSNTEGGERVGVFSWECSHCMLCTSHLILNVQSTLMVVTGQMLYTQPDEKNMVSRSPVWWVVCSITCLIKFSHHNQFGVLSTISPVVCCPQYHLSNKVFIL